MKEQQGKEKKQKIANRPPSAVRHSIRNRNEEDDDDDSDYPRGGEESPKRGRYPAEVCQKSDHGSTPFRIWKPEHRGHEYQSPKRLSKTFLVPLQAEQTVSAETISIDGRIFSS